jgi:general secretion pathway protein D
MNRNQTFRNLVGPLLVLAIGFGCLLPDALAQFTGRSSSRSGSNSAGGMGSRQYFNNTMLGDALIEFDVETRSIIVIADEETNLQITELIKELDKPKSQVLIKVAFVELTHNNNSDIGIDAIFSGSIGGGEGNSLTEGNALTAGTAFDLGGSGGLVQLNYDDVSVTMNALAEEGRLEILSRPSILTRNNREALISVGSLVPFMQTGNVNSVTGVAIPQYEYEPIGISLRVTPYITPHGLVELSLFPEISETTDEKIEVSEGLQLPVFATRSAQTVVVTPNGKTVIIGGLMQDNKVETVRKVPLLGDIPILGLLFKHTELKDTKTELLIFLTPFIVQNPNDLVSLTEQERSGSSVKAGTESGKRLDNFLNKDTEGKYIEASPVQPRDTEPRK